MLYIHLEVYRCHSNEESVIFIGIFANEKDDFPRQSTICTPLKFILSATDVFLIVLTRFLRNKKNVPGAPVP